MLRNNTKVQIENIDFKEFVKICKTKLKKIYKYRFLKQKNINKLIYYNCRYVAIRFLRYYILHNLILKSFTKFIDSGLKNHKLKLDDKENLSFIINSFNTINIYLDNILKEIETLVKYIQKFNYKL